MPSSSARSEAPWPISSSPSRSSTGWQRTGSWATRRLFDYLHRELRLSRGSAHYRQVATRLVVRFPEIVEPLRDGRLCLTTVIVLARVMTEANRHEVLPRFFGLSRQEAEQVAVEIRPVEVVPRRTVVTEAPVSKSAALPVTENVKECSRSTVELAPTRTLVEPLTPTGDPDARHGVAGVRGPA